MSSILSSLFSRSVKKSTPKVKSSAQGSKPELKKIVVLGCGAVGKSALIIQFIHGQFVCEFNPTIEDGYRKSDTVEDTSCLIDVLDTAGQEDFAVLRKAWVKGANVFILVYSVVDKESLTKLDQFVDVIREVDEERDSVSSIVLVGTKIDLPEHELTFEEGKEFALKLERTTGMRVSFFEASALKNINVRVIFHEAVKLLEGQSGNLNFCQPWKMEEDEKEATISKSTPMSPGILTSKKAVIPSSMTHSPQNSGVASKMVDEESSEKTATAASTKSPRFTAGLPKLGGKPTTKKDLDSEHYVSKSDFDQLLEEFREAQLELAETRKRLSDLESQLKEKQIL